MLASYRRLIVLCVYLALLFVNTGTAYGTQEKAVQLNLPFSSSDYSELTTQLRNALDQAQLAEVELVTAEHWHTYQNKLRLGRKGLYIAPPHFSSWAVHKFDFVAHVRLASPLSYVIATKRSNQHIFEMNDLADRPVCSSRPVNMDYLLINRAFDNPVLSARIKTVASVDKEMRQSNHNCDGFALTNQQYKSISAESPTRYIRLQQSAKYHNLALISDAESTANEPETIAKIIRLLNSEKGRQILDPWVSQYSSSKLWVASSALDYPSDYFDILTPFWQ